MVGQMMKTVVEEGKPPTEPEPLMGPGTEYDPTGDYGLGGFTLP